jgi:serine/threonine protein kinase
MPADPTGRIGRYRFDQRIGTGGMSQAWRGQLVEGGGRGVTGGVLEQLVIIKLLHPEHVDDPEFVEMFMDEARLTEGMSHPNVAQVHEAGTEDGVPFLVMEYVAGPDLTHVARQLRGKNERPYGVLARIFAGIARGLSHVHGATDADGKSLGIIHRDVSLGNIVVSESGAGKLIDFGIARWEERTTVTDVGMLKGKLHYMAPEQLEREYDHRVDIYQLGVCLYWLATGRPPYHADDPLQLWRDRLAGTAKVPSKLVAGFPRGLERIIVRAIDKNPDRRYRHAGEMAADLEAFCAAEGPWAASDADTARWVRGLFTDDDWSLWQPPVSEVQRTDRIEIPEDYRADDATAGARVARAFKDGRPLSAESLAGDVVSAAFADEPSPEMFRRAASTLGAVSLSRKQQPKVDSTAKLSAVELAAARNSARSDRRAEARPVVVTARRRRILSASEIRPWLAVLLGIGFVLAGVVAGVGLSQRSHATGDAAAQVYLEEAARLQAAGDPEGVLEMVEKARKCDPADPKIDVALTRLERVAAQR